MPTLAHSLSHTLNRRFCRWQTQKEQLNVVAQLQPLRNLPGVGFARQSSFKGKTFSQCHMLSDGLQRQPPSLYSNTLRGKGRQPGGNQVCIDEDGATRLLRQNSRAKVVFPAPFGPAMMMIFGGFTKLLQQTNCDWLWSGLVPQSSIDEQPPSAQL